MSIKCSSVLSVTTLRDACVLCVRDLLDRTVDLHYGRVVSGQAKARSWSSAEPSMPCAAPARFRMPACGPEAERKQGPFLSNSGRQVARVLRLAQDHRHRGVTPVQSPLILCKRHPEINPSMPLRRQPTVRGRCWSMMEIAGSAPTGHATGRSSRATASNTGLIRK
jgi:hypothetical protein